MLKDKTLTYISLFSCAGVGCFGFKKAGFECIATNELIERRLNVQKYNNKCRFESGYICDDITTDETKNKIFKERRINMFNSDLTKHLAELSKLEFTDEELEQMTADMTNIIAIMDKVCEFDTSKPAYALDAVDYKDLRADEHRNSYPTEEIVKNAKNVKNNSFVVPKVV